MDKKSSITIFSDFLKNIFFPYFCLGCQLEGVLLCQDCISTLEISEYNYCLCQKKPMRMSKGGKCSRCKNSFLNGLYFALSYKEHALIRRILYQFKYEPHIKELAKSLAEIFNLHFTFTGNNYAEFWQNGILMPIPAQKNRLKARGYNQAAELARQFSLIFSVPIQENNLVKIKKTPSQVGLSKEVRQKNLKNVFAIKTPSQIIGKKIFLVDDVYTTGSTMEECARTLKEAGAKQVWGLAIAREE